jgi:hypothetical protein
MHVPGRPIFSSMGLGLGYKGTCLSLCMPVHSEDTRNAVSPAVSVITTIEHRFPLCILCTQSLDICTLLYPD